MAEKKKTVSSGSTGRSRSGAGGRSSAKSGAKTSAKTKAEVERAREEALIRSKKRRNVISVVLMGLGVIMLLIAIIPSTKGDGWNALFSVMHGLFGIAAYAVGPLLIYAAVVVSIGRPDSASSLAIRIGIAMLILCAIFEIFMVGGRIFGEGEEKNNFLDVIAQLYTDGVSFRGGGFFALFVGVPLLFLGQLGAGIVIIILAIISIILIIDIPLNELGRMILSLFKSAGDSASKQRERSREDDAVYAEEYERTKQARAEQRREQKRRAEEERVRRSSRRRISEMGDVVDGIAKENERNGTAAPPPAAEPPKKKSASNIPEPPSNEEIIAEQRQDNRNITEELRRYMERRHPIMRDPEVPDPSKYEDDNAELVPILDALDQFNAEYKGPARVTRVEDAPKSGVTDSDKVEKTYTSDRFVGDDVSEIDEAELPFDMEDIIPEPQKQAPKPAAAPRPKPKSDQYTLSDVYTLPPMTLLDPPKQNEQQADVEHEMRLTADKLVSTLKSFGVETTFLGACRGPSVTRYELQPAPGVKMSKITGLSDDIALNLAASGVRIAPVPNKPAVGVEIPNKIRDTVYFRELVDTEDFKKTFGKKLVTTLGRDITGDTITCDVSKMPHILIAGTTGSGKSVCVNSIIMSILMKSTPDDVKLIMVDPKQVEFMMYNGIPHMLIPVVTEPKKAAGALAWAVTEMENRYTLFSENNVRNIDGYNDLADRPESGLEKMARVVIFIDELADLMMASPKDVEASIVRLAQKARAAGMHLVIATQKPTVQVVTGLIKGNIPSRIALLVASRVDSQVILDEGGADKLLGNGDMLYMPVGAPKPIRLQGCYVSDEEVERVVDFIKQTFTAEYDESIIAEIDRRAENVNAGTKPDDASEDAGDIESDDKLDEAIEFVVSAGQASTSALQRNLKLGYGRAARLIDAMEKMGIVGPFEGAKPRQVLITMQEWNERKLRN